MPRVTRSALLPYPAEAIFALINDVTAYPAYLPWCVASQVHEIQGNTVVASMTIAKSGITKQLKTKNTLEPPHKMTMTLLEGPFETFEGCWSIEPIGEEGCHVTLDLTFTFERGFLGKLIAPLFNQVADRLLDSFCQYAEKTLRARYAS